MSSQPLTPGREPRDELPRAALDAFRTELTGEVLLPTDADYDEARAIWNGMIDRYPAVIARCTDTDDVVTAVRFAREHDLPLAVRGGGHNVTGNAVCDDGLVVDLSEMNSVRVDLESHRAYVGGGATIGDVDRETQRLGLAVPLGVVSATGVAGLTLSGGLGHLRREYGLSLDNLTSVRIVTADGQVLRASESRHPDLFWAVRGGGGNLGIVTNFEYELQRVGPEVYGLFVWYHGEDAAHALRTFRKYAEGGADGEEPDRRGSVVAFTATVPELDEFPTSSWGESAVVFLGCYDGEKQAGETAFESLRTLADPVVDLSDSMAYTDLQTMLDEDYPDGLRYYWKAVYLDEMTDEVLDMLVEYGAASPSSLSTVDVWQLGGAIADAPVDATAFRHRESPYLVTFEANWEEESTDDENVAWARDGIAALRELGMTGGTYGNFPGFAEDPTRALFGENYDRMVEVKTTYDPENVFRLNLNVEPAGSD
jgi:FAD/FMN-containing dehydrogenase